MPTAVRLAVLLVASIGENIVAPAKVAISRPVTGRPRCCSCSSDIASRNRGSIRASRGAPDGLKIETRKPLPSAKA